MSGAKTGKNIAAAMATAAIVLPATLPVAASVPPAYASPSSPDNIVQVVYGPAEPSDSNVDPDEFSEVYGPASPNNSNVDPDEFVDVYGPAEPQDNPEEFVTVYGPAEPEKNENNIVSDGTILNMIFGNNDVPEMEKTEVTVPDAKTIGLWIGIIAAVVGTGAVAGVLIGKKDRNKIPQDLPMTEGKPEDMQEPEIPEGEPLSPEENATPEQ